LGSKSADNVIEADDFPTGANDYLVTTSAGLCGIGRNRSLLARSCGLGVGGFWITPLLTQETSMANGISGSRRFGQCISL
jgi:hypothetical protein